jgi:MFS family permease
MRVSARVSLPRDLYVAVGAKTISLLGTEVAMTALLLQLHDRGAGGWAIAGLLVAGTAPIVLMAPVAGLVVDRYDSRTLIVACGLWQAAACTALAFVTHPATILVLVALDALGLSVSAPSLGSLTRLIVADDRIAAATSLQQGGNVAATLAGPTVGGLLVGLTGGARVPLLLDAASFLVISAAGLLIHTRRRPKNSARRSRARDGIVWLFSDRALAPVMMLAVLLIVIGQVTAVAEVFLVRDTFRSSTLTFGLLQATWVLGSMFGTVFASRLNTAARILRGVPTAAAMMAASVALTGLLRSLPAAFMLFIVAGAASGVVSVGTGTMVLLRTEESVLGRVLASFTGVLQSASMVAFGLGGLIIGVLAPEMVFTMSGTLTLISVLAIAPVFRRARTAI